MYRYLQKCLYRGLCPKLSTNLSLIYKKANRMLANPSRYHYSDMMRKALVYVTSNWEDLIKYRNDGHFYNRQYARRTTSIYGKKEELIVFQ